MKTLSEELLELVEQLPPQLQLQVVEYARCLLQSVVANGSNREAVPPLQRFVDGFTPEEAEVFAKCIEESFEKTHG